MKNKVYANYDWDDNILFMPTRIVYFAKDPNALVQEIAISTEGFAHTRSHVSKEDYILCVKRGGVEHGNAFVDCPEYEAETRVNLKNFEIVGDNSDARNRFSFREFRDHDTQNLFIRDMKEALQNNKLAPSFKDFVEHCSNRLTASHVTIITARGQSPETIHAGLVYMQEMGILKYVPPVDNIFPVSSEKLPDRFKTSAENPQNAKINVLCEIMDRIEASGVDGVTFGFSDDDKKTFDTTKAFMLGEVEKGRWSKFEINLYFTGNKTKDRHRLLERKTILA